MTFRASLVPAVALSAALGLVMAFGQTSLEGQESSGTAALMNPADLTEQAPATYKASFDTSVGTFVVEVHRDWAPLGADRFYNLVKRGFYDGCRFVRVVPKVLAQFGTSGDPALTKVWSSARIPDDPLGKQRNQKGTIAFVAGAPTGRSTQVFINLEDNPGMDGQAAPFGQVTSGMEVLENLYSGYGDTPPTGRGPNLNRVNAEGNVYLEREFPKLSYIKAATVVAAEVLPEFIDLPQ